MLKNCKIIYIYDKISLYFRDIDTPYPFARKRPRHKKRNHRNTGGSFCIVLFFIHTYTA